MTSHNDSVTALTEAFHDFKAINDERLLHLERKGAVDPFLEEKLARVEHTLSSIETRLNQHEVAHQRPQLDTTLSSPDACDSRGAFVAYLAKGDEQGLRSIEHKSLSVGNDPDGGYTVPSQIRDALVKDIEDYSPLRRLASVITISTDAVEMLVDRDAADAGWVGERDERPETSAPELARLRIPVHEMYAKPRATQKLLDDAAINVEEWLVSKVSQKMACLENEAFLKGEGVYGPRGLLSYLLHFTSKALPHDHLGAIKTGASGAFHADHPADSLIELAHTLKPAYLAKASWLMARATLAEVRKLKDQNGNYLWQPALDHEPVSKLLGYPVVLCDDMPILKSDTASSSIIFGDFKEGYCIVDRMNTRVLRDPFSAKPYVEFYVTRRVGGAITNNQALKVLFFSA